MNILQLYTCHAYTRTYVPETDTDDDDEEMEMEMKKYVVRRCQAEMQQNHFFLSFCFSAS